MSSLVSSGRDVSPVAGRLGSERREGDPGGEGSVWESRRGRDSGPPSRASSKWLNWATSVCPRRRQHQPRAGAFNRLGLEQDRDPDSAAFVGAVGFSGEVTEALSLAPDA
uniref:Uncharacterized protein n=1 Tax=Rangifer tarandus platyrhynchus TaxID=3082113 RepID=A0ACB0E882_RANTA|nr:unnamed protein product [Rangifer tarandus platyrhynchus]